MEEEGEGGVGMGAAGTKKGFGGCSVRGCGGGGHGWEGGKVGGRMWFV